MTLPGHRPLLPIPGYRRIHSNAQLAGIELTDGALLPVSNADEARIRFNLSLNQLQASLDASSYSAILTAEGFGIFRPEWYGAVGDGVHDDTTAIQTAVDMAMDYGGGTVLMTPGRRYLITAPIIAGRRSGGLWVYSTWAMRCFQGKTSASYLTTGAVIQYTFLDLPGLIIEAGAGVLVEGVRFVGVNNIAAAIFADAYDSLLVDSNFAVPGLRTNARSPQAGIVVDAFKAAVPVGDRYPGLGSYYVDGANSSQIVIRDCGLYRNAVGISWTPHAGVANGDNSRIEGCHFEENRVGFQVLGSQARNLTLDWCDMGIGMFCVANLPVDDFDTSLSGCPPRINGGCFGQSKYLFAMAPLADTFYASGIYCESVLSIGYIGTIHSQNWLPASFYGCQFSIWQTSERQIDTKLFALAPVTFKSCAFSEAEMLTTYNAASSVTKGRVSFEDCHFFGRTDGEIGLSVGDPAATTMTGSQFLVAGIAWYDGPVRTEVVPLGSGITIADNLDGTVTFTATVGVMPTVNVGDPVCITDGSPTNLVIDTYDPGAYHMFGAFGVVESVNGFIVTARLVAQSLIADGLSLYTLNITRILRSNESVGSTWTGDRLLTHVGTPHASLPSDSQVGIDTTGGVATYTLPPVGTSEGRNIFVYDWGQNASVNPITVAAQGGETINGVASINITTDGAGAWCKCDGAVWKTVAVA